MKKKRFNKELVIVMLFLSMQILFHLFMKVSNDDLFFRNILDQMNWTLLDGLSLRYHDWSSRTVIDTLLFFFAKHFLLWEIADIGVSLLLLYSLYQLSNNVSLFATATLILSYRLIDMSSAGWIATMMNYYWPLSFGFYSFSVLRRMLNSRPVRKWEKIASIPALLLATNAEQYCGLYLLILSFYTILLLLDRHVIPHSPDSSESEHDLGVIRCTLPVLLLHWAVTLTNLGYILLCEGNYNRVAEESARAMPNIYEMNFLDKSINGFQSTMSSLMLSENPLFMIFTLFLFISVLMKTTSCKDRLIALFPFAITFGMKKGRTLSCYYFHAIPRLLADNPGVSADGWDKLHRYLPLIFYISVIVAILVSILIICDQLVLFLELSYFFLTAIGSRVVLGFSPTLYDSGDRTFLFLYGVLILLILKLFNHWHRFFTEKSLYFLMGIWVVNVSLNNLNDVITWSLSI